MRARVFISCGQKANTDEVDIADNIAKVLEGFGYEPYIAVVEQTLKGLTDNIFTRLSEAEYFLFIDFQREQLPGKGSECHRGSLFSHQELGIAAFLKKPVIAFREKSVLRSDGIIRFLQANCEEFSDRSSLPSLVGQRVCKEWKPNWRNELDIRREDGQFQDMLMEQPNRQQPRRARFFHLSVMNLNAFKTANNCCAYLLKAQVLPEKRELPLREVEFKWRGVVFPNVIVPPARMRDFDAFLVFHDSPAQAITGALTDSAELKYVFPTGDYLLTFGVRSENFPETTKQFFLKVGGSSVEHIMLSEKLLGAY